MPYIPSHFHVSKIPKHAVPIPMMQVIFGQLALLSQGRSWQSGRGVALVRLDHLATLQLLIRVGRPNDEFVGVVNNR